MSPEQAKQEYYWEQARAEEFDATLKYEQRMLRETPNLAYHHFEADLQKPPEAFERQGLLKLVEQQTVAQQITHRAKRLVATGMVMCMSVTNPGILRGFENEYRGSDKHASA